MFVPLIVTDVRGRSLSSGVNVVACGGGSTVNFVALATNPAGVVTLIGPVVAPVSGVTAVIWVSESTLADDAELAVEHHARWRHGSSYP